MEAAREPSHASPVQAASPAPGTLVALRPTWGGPLLRLAAGWAFLAGAAAAGGRDLLGASPLTLALGWLLADPAWGAAWTLLAERERPLPALGRRLPYATPEGLAGRPGWLAAAGNAVALLALLVAPLAWAVGPAALALSAVVAALAALGWLARRTARLAVARWLQALAQIAAPFALGVLLAAPTMDWPQAAWLAGAGLGLTLAFRSSLAGRHGEEAALAIGLAAAVVLVGALAAAGRLMAAGVAAAAVAAPLWMTAQPGPRRLAGADAWWWAVAAWTAGVLGFA
ncbi:MAG: hypothetical protein RMN53_14530 [Anaerolineae bacterium]|nr:hypothetical protein [Anaerolineae bacterium]